MCYYVFANTGDMYNKFGLRRWKSKTSAWAPRWLWQCEDEPKGNLDREARVMHDKCFVMSICLSREAWSIGLGRHSELWSALLLCHSICTFVYVLPWLLPPTVLLSVQLKGRPNQVWTTYCVISEFSKWFSGKRTQMRKHKSFRTNFKIVHYHGYQLAK